LASTYVRLQHRVELGLVRDAAEVDHRVHAPAGPLDRRPIGDVERVDVGQAQVVPGQPVTRHPADVSGRAGDQNRRTHDCGIPARVSGTLMDAGIHARFLGGPAGTPVVLVHGLAVTHRYLMPTARLLATRRPVVAPDLPGFGRSVKPGRSYAVDDHARALAYWLDSCGLDRIGLVGHSFGAEVAARLAVLRPGLVAALVLAGPTTDPAGRTWPRLVARFAADVLLEQQWQIPLLAEGIATARPWRVAATVGHSLANAIEDDLVRLPVAPLILAGALDPIAPPRWRTEAAALSNGVVRSVPEAAHNVLTTSPRRSAASIDAHVRHADAVGSRRTPGP
jgi:pimeloyl-ACP methyl ester carboxylesterase